MSFLPCQLMCETWAFTVPILSGKHEADAEGLSPSPETALESIRSRLFLPISPRGSFGLLRNTRGPRHQIQPPSRLIEDLLAARSPEATKFATQPIQWLGVYRQQYNARLDGHAEFRLRQMPSVRTAAQKLSLFKRILLIPALKYA